MTPTSVGHRLRVELNLTALAGVAATAIGQREPRQQRGWRPPEARFACEATVSPKHAAVPQPSPLQSFVPNLNPVSNALSQLAGQRRFDTARRGPSPVPC